MPHQSSSPTTFTRTSLPRRLVRQGWEPRHAGHHEHCDDPSEAGTSEPCLRTFTRRPRTSWDVQECTRRPRRCSRRTSVPVRSSRTWLAPALWSSWAVWTPVATAMTFEPVRRAASTSLGVSPIRTTTVSSGRSSAVQARTRAVSTSAERSAEPAPYAPIDRSTKPSRPNAASFTRAFGPMFPVRTEEIIPGSRTTASKALLAPGSTHPRLRRASR